MSEVTNISWTDSTFNPWIGCTKVSPGCANCYAETMMDKRYHRVVWGKGNPRQRTSAENWRKPIRWDREAEKEGRRRRVFCASLADVFDAEVPDKWRRDLWTLIRNTPNLDWQLLTKRHGNVKAMVPPDWLTGAWPSNAWIGVSAEDQVRADERIPKLVTLPAPVRFVSAEPLLGPLDLTRYVGAGKGIDWIIVGGESGKGARPMEIEWARDIRDQCEAAGIAYFLKQLGGEHDKGDRPELDGRRWEEFPPPLGRDEEKAA